MAEPQEVPILTARNCTVGPYQTGGQCGCLAFWRYKLFGSGRLAQRHEAMTRNLYGFAVTGPRDEREGWTPRDTAKALNRIHAELGYSEDNPETKNLGKTVHKRIPAGW